MQAETTYEQVGKYRLLKKLATGGMAHIFLAEQSGLGGFRKRLVIKRILPHLVGDEKFLQMFQDEARVAAMMNHPNIVQIFELGEADKSYYIAMEYVSGFNLREVIQRSNENGIWLAPEYIAKLGSQICEGLEYAHNFCDDEGNHLNIIHRDISPQNIILSNQGIIKIVDFGIAKAKSNAQETQAGIIKGKLAYMSPEQVKGQTLDRRSDLFSLGIVLHELATHQRPFQGKSDIDMLRAILDSSPARVEDMRPDFPIELSNIIYKALAKNRDDRYPSAREFQWDLEQFIQSSGKAVTTFQLRELVSKLEQLDTNDSKEEVSGSNPAPAPPQPAQAQAAPTPPPAPPIPAKRPGPPPPPPPTPGGNIPASPQRGPAAPEDFDEDGETMWATDIKLPPGPPGGSAPAGNVVAQLPPQPSAQIAPAQPAMTPPPASSRFTPPPQQPNWAQPQTSSTPNDDWEEEDATVLSPSPLAVDFKPEAPPGMQAPTAQAPRPNFNQLGHNDLDTITEPGLDTVHNPSSGIAPDVLNSYLPNPQMGVPNPQMQGGDLPTLLDQPSLGQFSLPNQNQPHQRPVVATASGSYNATQPTQQPSWASPGAQAQSPQPRQRARHRSALLEQPANNNKKLILIVSLLLVLTAAGVLTYMFAF